VSLDGRWTVASLRPAIGIHAWCRWTARWRARRGEHELACRATDSSGAMQPLEPPWNYQGMGNNAVQRVPVTVR
jgi:hypothetical protein